MTIHPDIARELAEAAIADDYSGKSLVERVAAAIMAAVEMEPDANGIIGRRSGEIPVRGPVCVPGFWSRGPRRA